MERNLIEKEERKGGRRDGKDRGEGQTGGVGGEGTSIR